MKRISLLIIAGSLLSLPAKAQIQCQQQPMWCWAACIQSSLGQANVAQTQAQIVARLTGWPQNVPATISQVIQVLRSYNFRAWSVAYPANPGQLYTTLASGWKLIAFVNPSNNPRIGHFIMLQGISPATGRIIVSDPAPPCATYEQDVEHLYYAWRWSSSIVVGTP